MRITILGCGASAGVPVIGCQCETCVSSHPKNKRLRASICVEYDDGFTVLVDTTPDLRTQALNYGLTRVDAVIFTHAHADHLHGLDDLRAFNKLRNASIPAYFTAQTHTEINARFPYAFKPHEEGAYWSRVVLEPYIIDAYSEIVLFNGEKIQTFGQGHGSIETLGIRFNKSIYSTDFNEIPVMSEPYLQNADLWILDALRHGPAGHHNSVEQALKWVEKFKPKQAVLTHMNHELAYEVLEKQLPEHIFPAFDGLKL